MLNIKKNKEKMSFVEAEALISGFEEAQSIVQSKREAEQRLMHERYVKQVLDSLKERNFVAYHQLLASFVFSNEEKEHFALLYKKEQDLIVQETLPSRASYLSIDCRDCGERLPVVLEESFLDLKNLCLVGFCKKCNSRSVMVGSSDFGRFSIIEQHLVPLVSGQLT